MTEKNIFVFVINSFRFNFIFYDKTTTSPPPSMKKVTSSFPPTSLSKLRSCQAPSPFSKFGRGLNASPLRQSRKEGGVYYESYQPQQRNENKKILPFLSTGLVHSIFLVDIYVFFGKASFLIYQLQSIA